MAHSQILENHIAPAVATLEGLMLQDASKRQSQRAAALDERPISPSCMTALLLHQRRCRCRQCDAGDFSAAGQHRDILRRRTMLDRCPDASAGRTQDNGCTAQVRKRDGQAAADWCA